jgi:hypothetical protein
MEVHSIETIVRALNEAGAQRLIVGGLAVNAHGYERFTKNLDLVIGLERENIIRGLRALMAMGYNMRIPVTPSSSRNGPCANGGGVKKTWLCCSFGALRIVAPQSICLFMSRLILHGRWRAQREPVFGSEAAPIVSYETLLDLKKSAGRGQDLLDIEKLRKLDPFRKKP